MFPRSHPSPQEILLAVDGELTPRRLRQMERHLATCWACRAKKRDIESSIADFVCAYEMSRNHDTSSPETATAAFRERLRAVSAELERGGWRHASALAQHWRLVGWVGAIAILVLTFTQWYSRTHAFVAVSRPDPQLTPGATVWIAWPEVCRLANVKNRPVPSALRQAVFKNYGIRNAPRDAYEIDYLITPALGGAEDIHNLWPHSFSATKWNARIKDELEDRLREMVCDGRIDLATAQREIAEDWIAAYRKYFRDPTIPE